MNIKRLNDRMHDGFTAPRWGHHLFKIATGGAFLAAFYAMWRDPLVASALSLAGFLLSRVIYKLTHRSEPFFKRDLWCDLALHVVSMAIFLPPARAAAAVAACVVVYVLSVDGSSP